MQLWRLEPLKSVLAAGPLPDRQAVQYIAVQAAIVAAAVIPTPGQDLPPWWHLVIAPVVAIAGVYFCYKQNGGARGERFTERYFSLGWVVAVRVAVASGAIGAAVSILVFAVRPAQASDDLWVGLFDVISYGLMVLTFWRTGVHVADVSRRAGAMPVSKGQDA